MSTDVTVCIPSIPTRAHLVAQRALPSVSAQTVKPDAIAISIDNERSGAWTNRNKAMAMVQTKWLAFLDDDDELLPHHLEHLLWLAESTNSDVCYGWFEVIGGNDPFPQHRGRQFDIADPHIFPITALVNADLVKSSGACFEGDPGQTGNWGVQDLPFWRTLWDAGAKFMGSETVTWRWHHHVGNTSGLPSRWQR